MFAVDTHVHSCLSPCAELDMHPAGLVAAAVAAGLDAVAVCDHNSAENAGASIRAAQASGLTVIPGMEITSEEEVHILGLMPSLEAALELQARVYRALPGRNDANVFGLQVIANEQAEVVGFNEHLLSGATTMAVEEVVAAIHLANGLAVASHVDREGFGIVGQLGMIPRHLPLDALEVSPRTPLHEARTRFARDRDLPLISASDAHEPKDVGRAVTFMRLEQASFPELRQALLGIGGRMILGGGKIMEDLALHILDIAQNSVEAGATAIEIAVTEDQAADTLVIEVSDNGWGMAPEVAARSTDPFYTTRATRRVGLGLSLLGEAARAAGGSLRVESRRGEGTRVWASFQHSHLDRAPLGDVETTIMVLAASHPDLEIRFLHRQGTCWYLMDTRDLRTAGIDLSSPEGLGALRRILRKGEGDLREGIDN